MSGKYVVTFLLLLGLAYGEWRLWPRTMPTYRKAPVNWATATTTWAIEGTSAIEGFYLHTFAGPIVFVNGYSEHFSCTNQMAIR